MKDLPLDATELSWLAGLARALLGEPHAADDLVQETAVAVLERPLPTGAPRRAWLASVARRLAARRFRGDARRTQREQRVARPEAVPDATALLETAEVAEQVAAAARRLPEPFRRTILLRFLEGLSIEEIAAADEKPVDTVRWRVRRGLALLREELVRTHDRDWSSWSVLLVPLARSNGGAGIATAGAAGVFSGWVVSVTAMKALVTMVVTLGCAGLWLVRDTGGEGRLVEPVQTDGPAIARADRLAFGDTAPARPREAAPADPATEGREATESVSAPEPTTEPPGTAPAPRGLVGRVVDEDGAPIADATVYLIPSARNEERRFDGEDVRVRTVSDWRGSFQFTPDAWTTDDPADGARGEVAALDLGVVANGFLRTVIPDVLEVSPPNSDEREETVVVLERGRSLSGRVVDSAGRPVPDLELLVHSPYGAIDHVSPSQRRLRAERSHLAGAASGYEQCRATTNARGELEFTGLPAGDLMVLALDPGWTIETPGRVEADGTRVQWTAQRRLGVRLNVVDARTGRPVERAEATFGLELTFADGEFRDLSQWVGRGSGEVTFVLGGELLPGLEERVITKATFYGTANAPDGAPVSWRAPELSSAVGSSIAPGAGVTGVAEVRVEVEPRATASPDGLSSAREAAGKASLELDVVYEDATPFDGRLTVRWQQAGESDWDEAERLGPGRYRQEIPAGDLTIEVSDRFATGSLPAWREELSTFAGQDARLTVTLRRGASATITRPEGWSGEWFLEASFRTSSSEPWQGSWGYSTAEERITLIVLRPVEWRFALRRESMLERNPIVRTARLQEGRTVLVDG